MMNLCTERRAKLENKYLKWMEYTEGLRSRRPKGWPNKSSKILTTRALPSQKPQSQKEFWFYKSTCNFLIQCRNWKSAVYLKISEENILTCIPRAPSCFSLMAIASFFFSFLVERRTSSTWEEFHKARYIIGNLNKKSSSIALGNAHHTFSTGDANKSDTNSVSSVSKVYIAFKLATLWCSVIGQEKIIPLPSNPKRYITKTRSEITFNESKEEWK